MSDDFWNFIKPFIPKPKPTTEKGGRPRIKDLRKLMNGILYVLRTGCQWKMIPKEYYPGSTTHNYFQEWVKRGIFKKIWKHCLKEYDDLKGIKWEWQILDSQTIQSPVKGEKNR